jgi:hypothetical protein
MERMHAGLQRGQLVAALIEDFLNQKEDNHGCIVGNSEKSNHQEVETSSC